MLPTTKNKIKFAKWFSIIVMAVFIGPLYYSIFEPEVLDDENLKFSKFIILFFLAFSVVIAMMCFDIKSSIALDRYKNDIQKAQQIRETARKFNNLSSLIFFNCFNRVLCSTNYEYNFHTWFWWISTNLFH